MSLETHCNTWCAPTCTRSGDSSLAPQAHLGSGNDLTGEACELLDTFLGWDEVDGVKALVLDELSDNLSPYFRGGDDGLAA